MRECRRWEAAIREIQLEAPAPEGATGEKLLTACLKACPDTKRECFHALRTGCFALRTLLDRIVGSLASDHDVVHVTLAQARSTDAHEACLLQQFGDCGTTAVAHARFQSAAPLVDALGHPPAIAHAHLAPV